MTLLSLSRVHVMCPSLTCTLMVMAFVLTIPSGDSWDFIYWFFMIRMLWLFLTSKWIKWQLRGRELRKRERQLHALWRAERRNKKLHAITIIISRSHFNFKGQRMTRNQDIDTHSFTLKWISLGKCVFRWFIESR